MSDNITHVITYETDVKILGETFIGDTYFGDWMKYKVIDATDNNYIEYKPKRPPYDITENYIDACKRWPIVKCGCILITDCKDKNCGYGD